MNTMRWEALEYKYALQLLSFLAFRIKNPVTPSININTLTIIHHSNLNVQKYLC